MFVVVCCNLHICHFWIAFWGCPWSKTSLKGATCVWLSKVILPVTNTWPGCAEFSDHQTGPWYVGNLSLSESIESSWSLCAPVNRSFPSTHLLYRGFFWAPCFCSMFLCLHPQLEQWIMLNLSNIEVLTCSIKLGYLWRRGDFSCGWGRRECVGMG